MNFGDILNKWEKVQSHSSVKNDMEKWLEENEIHDKDADGHKSAGPGLERRKLLSKQPDDILDIHGLTSEQAWISLDSFFTKAKDNGFLKLRIIHGKGNHSQGEAILRGTVCKFIEKCPFAGQSGHEKAANGGSGATWVLLK